MAKKDTIICFSANQSQIKIQYTKEFLKNRSFAFGKISTARSVHFFVFNITFLQEKHSIEADFSSSIS
jgi:hypothetical protein